MRDVHQVVRDRTVRLYACWLPPGGTTLPAHLAAEGTGVVTHVTPARVDVPSPAGGAPAMTSFVATVAGDGSGTVLVRLTFPGPGHRTTDFQNIDVRVFAHGDIVGISE